ncbi:N-formylmethionyl-tRNA deformylase [Salipiger sp. CCB-MM3]|uniref:peptide deformylase n=1 Tax=Salipiger sp. CCB-MM3 TaxID=1792508 RepID=UPI00080AAA3A|nr:peptide deformylase [Salipiger sp. CCB-MM3]ANT60417.1 N-formylmethionyl-tRNA deformylase [Salipiger sp. CCB-MM3]
MSLLPILRWPDPRLSQVCAEVASVAEVTDLVTDMFETMYDAPGRGLAGPQVGAMVRVFVMDAGWKDGEMNPLACINPRILWASDETVTGGEGCLSIPGVTAQVTRAARIRLGFTDLTGAAQEVELSGPEAIVAQHEYDHLDGLVHFDRLEPAARDALTAEYDALA